MASDSRPKIVILGAGFAGMAAARELARLLPDGQAQITLVDENNFLLFTPMLTEVAGGEVDPVDIVAAVRAMVPQVRFEQGRVERIDIDHHQVSLCIGGDTAGVDPMERTLHADQLVIALGSVTNFHGIPGLAEHAVGIKSVAEAEAIRNRALALLELADEEPDSDRRRRLLTFVVGGGGFSGVETVAALNDLIRRLAPHYRRVAPADIRTMVVHPGARLLPELSEGLAAYTRRALEQRGVEVMLHTLVAGAGPECVEIKAASKDGSDDARRIEAGTLIWAGGVKPNPVIDAAGLRLGKHHGIVVDGCCRVEGRPGIWALGDCAEIPRPDGKGTYAPTAQNATREGKQVAENIVATLTGGETKPFVYHPVGELAIVGRHAGVANVYGVHVSGVLAWAMWRAIYLAKLPRLTQRLRVAGNWLVDALAGRDIAALPGAPTKRT